MTAAQSILPLWTGAVLVLAVGVGVMRLWLWRQAAPADQRTPPRRLVLLVLLQVLAGVMLFLALHPPVSGSGGATLVVATRGAGTPEVSNGDILVALPEAGPVEGAERVPDLATAIRRYPQTGRLQVIGEGLPARDREPVSLPLRRGPPPPVRGIVEVALPPPVAPGSGFTVAGRVGALPSGTVELVDPAGTIVARSPVAAGRRFILHGAARAEGAAVFELRLRDATGRLIQALDAPVHTRADPAARVIALSGAPGPEVNFLRRWAEDAGVELTVGIDLGGGVRLGTAPPALSSAELARTDLLIVDDRSWERLDAAARGLVARAVEDGMGLLLQPTSAMAAATRREWAVLGAPIAGDGTASPLSLPEIEGAPDLVRWNLSQARPDSVAAVQAPDGTPLANWRARGRGRIGVWTVRDSYVLALAGRADAHADLWSDVFSALSRPIPAERPRLVGLARVGERAVVCGVAPGDAARPIDGPPAILQVDPRSGPERCAAFWPSRAGWTRVGGRNGEATPLYVHPAQAGPSLRAQDAARPLDSRREDRPVGGRDDAPLDHRLLLSVLLMLLAGLWFLERHRPADRRPGRAEPDTPAPNAG